MDKLPLELIEKILSNNVLSIEDVVSFSSTCTRFRNSVLNSSVIWKRKFHDNYPKFVDLFDGTCNNFFEEIRYIYELKKRTLALLETMPSRFYVKYLLSEMDLEEWDKLMKEKKETYYYLISNLTEIIKVNEQIKSIEVVPLNTPGNKTLQYHARKALLFIRQQYLTGVWEDFRRLPPKKQLLEKAAGFVALWCQADTDLGDDDIQNELDKIANLVKERLFEANPSHGIFKAKQSDLEEWKNENLETSKWGVVECRQVMGAMRDVLYSDLSYCGNRENYYQSDNSLINKVMEYRTGLPIILAIIYESVGRRLGLHFQPINFPAHFLLRFTEEDGSKRSSYYIDTFNDGIFIRNPTCPYRPRVQREELLPVASAPQVVERIVNNLELSIRQHIEPNGRDTLLRSILELQLLINPLNLETVVNLARLYTMHKINTKKLEPYTKSPCITIPHFPPDLLEKTMALIESTTRESQDLNIQTKSFQVQRSDDVSYAVGMVMTDLTHKDRCVIYDWTPEFSASHDSWESRWCNERRQRQPFYSVLVEDGSTRYLPQEVLAPSSDGDSLQAHKRLLGHKELGRYFSHFFVNHFVPNAEKEREYPWDKIVRQKYYYNQQLNQYTF